LPTSEHKQAGGPALNIFHLEDETENPAPKLICLLRRLVELRTIIKSKEALDSGEILQASLQIEADLVSWEASLPLDWKFVTIETEEEYEYTYSGKYHIYNDIWTANMFNHYRTMRIIVNEIILDHLPALSTSFSLMDINLDLQKRQSMQAISQNALHICLGVHFHLNHNEILQSRNRSPPTIESRESQITGVFTTLWPLKLAGSSRGVKIAVFTWIVKSLQRIRCTMGIELASTYATSLVEERRLR
jgi:hypothetical protein